MASQQQEADLLKQTGKSDDTHFDIEKQSSGSIPSAPVAAPAPKSLGAGVSSTLHAH
jgi:hypothetical protein